MLIHNRISDESFLGFKFDWTLNITSVISILALLYTLTHFGTQIVNHLQSIDSKTNIMWTHFDKNQLTKEELLQLGVK